MGPATLAQVLRPLARRTDPRLIVGLQTSDDAAVFALTEDRAIVQTVDFFAPIVDDPYHFGQIAAANSLSDLYAMGGDVLFALNIAAFPEDLPTDVITAVFEGGADKVGEAGAVIAGGHTVVDPEPKYGLVVTGTVDPRQVWTKAGARPGDALYLTKPLGSGIITTALKRGAAIDTMLTTAVAHMTTLNRAASQAARSVSIHACTDVTGFGLLGHTWEMATKSEVCIQIAASRVPLLEGVVDLARAGNTAGGLGRNRSYYCQAAPYPVFIDDGLDPALSDVLFDPQTSGGLLLSVAEPDAPRLEAAFKDAGVLSWQIGTVHAGEGVRVRP